MGLVEAAVRVQLVRRHRVSDIVSVQIHHTILVCALRLVDVGGRDGPERRSRCRWPIAGRRGHKGARNRGGNHEDGEHFKRRAHCDGQIILRTPSVQPRCHHPFSRWEPEVLAYRLQELQMMRLDIRDRLHELRKDVSSAVARHPRLIRGTLAAFGAAALLSIAGSVWLMLALARGLPDMDAVRRIGAMDQATAVYDASDALAFTIYKEQRIDATLAEVSPYLIDALISTEDQHFYAHHGFDLGRIASAAFANLRHRRVTQGASTLTQQLARQSFLTPDKTLRRKLQELILAGRIERLYSKQQILELYLNKVYFGDGLYGVEAASRGYFGKRASELTLSEAALLAGL